MTKVDAEQHAEVWALAYRAMLSQMKRAKDGNLVDLVTAQLAVSDLALAVSQGYETIVRSMQEDD